MIRKTTVLRYTIDVGVIPVSNDRTRFPLRAQYGRKPLVWLDDQFAILLKTELFTHRTRHDYEIDLSCTCFVCGCNLLTKAMEVGYLYCSSHHVSRHTKRDFPLGSINVDKTSGVAFPVSCKYIVEDRQPYLAYVHKSCYAQYELSPLGFNLESRTNFVI